jgi:hypothetical protein
MVPPVERCFQGSAEYALTTACHKNTAMAEHAEELVQPRLVTGRLDALDFQSRTLRLKLPDERVLSGTYGDAFEPILLEHPREWIQVRGEATLAEDGTLLNLDNITEIIEVDESPIVVTAFHYRRRRYSAIRPLEFPVTFNLMEGIYTVVGDFHVLVAAETRSELEDAVASALEFLWDEYVVSDRQTLSGDAQSLRERLKRAFTGDANAA